MPKFTYKLVRELWLQARDPYRELSPTANAEARRYAVKAGLTRPRWKVLPEFVIQAIMKIIQKEGNL